MFECWSFVTPPAASLCRQGETTTTRTVWTHAERSGKDKVFKDVITVSRFQHVLPPGMHQYPFAYKIPEHVPGCAKFKRKEHARDPAWRSADHKLEAKAEVVFTLKAVLDAAGVFSRDLKSRQELVVNPFFDWARMTPQRSSQQGTVMFLCCIPRGMVYLDAAFDKGAYAAGETAQISATIRNESKSNVKTSTFCNLGVRMRAQLLVSTCMHTARVCVHVGHSAPSGAQRLLRIVRTLCIMWVHTPCIFLQWP